MKTADIANKPPSAWIPETDPVKIAILNKSIEEASELIKILARCTVQGIGASDPETGEPNRQELADELDDMQAMIGIIRNHFGIEPNTERQSKKRSYQWAWYAILEVSHGDEAPMLPSADMNR